MVDKTQIVIAGKDFEIVDFKPRALVLKYVGPIEDPDGFQYDVRYYVPYMKFYNLKSVVDIRPGAESKYCPGAFLVDTLKWG